MKTAIVTSGVNSDAKLSTDEVFATDLPPARSCASGAAGGQNVAVQDAQSTNRASYKCNPDYFKALRWGVDSLYLSYPGELLPEVQVRLEALKKIAQSPDPFEQCLAQYPLLDGRFEVKDKGAPLFPYILEDGSFRIQLSRPGKKLPMAYVKISSGYLAHVGPRKAEEALSQVLQQLGTLTGIAQVSRIDMFSDFASSQNMEEWDREAWVTRAAGVTAYAVDGHFTGWAVGMGGTMAARLYDKSLEIQKSGKNYLLDLWRQAGWKEEEPVWRLEFQFKREVLAQLGVGSLADVLDHLNGLWSYAITEWLKLTLPNPDDKTRSRWPIHPLWAYLSSVDWETDGGPLSRHYSPARVPGDKKLMGMALSTLVSFMAREGIEDPYQGHRELMMALYSYHSPIAERLGFTFDTYIDQKLGIKARLFNTLINDPDALTAIDQKALEDSAREYRRASGGES